MQQFFFHSRRSIEHCKCISSNLMTSVDKYSVAEDMAYLVSNYG